jgi:hypothetical protein
MQQKRRVVHKLTSLSIDLSREDDLVNLGGVMDCIHIEPKAVGDILMANKNNKK